MSRQNDPFQGLQWRVTDNYFECSTDGRTWAPSGDTVAKIEALSRLLGFARETERHFVEGEGPKNPVGLLHAYPSAPSARAEALARADDEVARLLEDATEGTGRALLVRRHILERVLGLLRAAASEDG